MTAMEAIGVKFKVLYSEIALCWKQFGTGHMYEFTFLLRMTDTMTSLNIELPPCDILYSIKKRGADLRIQRDLKSSYCGIFQGTVMTLSGNG